MKKLISLFIFALLMLSACVTTNVYPGEKEGRKYISQNIRVCETMRFTCDEGQTPFNDYTGCGCEVIKGYEPDDTISNDQLPIPDEEPVDESEPTSDIECGIVDGDQISCDEGMCAMVEGENSPRCVSDDFCDDFCSEGFECVIMESYPVQIRCNQIVEEGMAEEEFVEDEEVVEEVTEEDVVEEESVEESVEE